jgi:MerR family transcriptional regulator/heat shock protein HspR
VSPQKKAKSRKRARRIDSSRGVFMISVAAELADMHPQTLRMYEARADVDRLRKIQEMTEAGLNLAGVETVLEMERQLNRLERELSRTRERAAEAERRMIEEIERARRSLRAKLVPYGAYEPGDLMASKPSEPRKIPVERPRDSKHAGGG